MGEAKWLDKEAENENPEKTPEAVEKTPATEAENQNPEAPKTK
jgi:hypothetical protein